MKKIVAVFLSVALLILVGCSASKTDDNIDTTATTSHQTEAQGYVLNYSNIADNESKQFVSDALKSAGVSNDRIDAFLGNVEQFNSSVDSSLLIAGFEDRDILSPKYDVYDYQDQWMAKNPDFNGYNCRITAFELFGDFVDIKDGAEIRDSELFMDFESLEVEQSAFFYENDMQRFSQLFSIVPTDNTKDINVHYQNVVDDFNSRGIGFKSGDISLVTVWFHNQWSADENELFVGHTGVLVEKDGKLVFVEKLAFQEPYQAIILDDRQELVDYLMAKYDTAWGQETASPFVMENTTLLS